MSRTGPPVAPFTLLAPTKTVAPTGGTSRRFATSSTPHLPVASQALCGVRDVEARIKREGIDAKPGHVSRPCQKRGGLRREPRKVHRAGGVRIDKQLRILDSR